MTPQQESAAHQPHVKGGPYDWDCSLCANILRLARDWEGRDAKDGPSIWSRTEVVDAYRHHAKKMSES